MSRAARADRAGRSVVFLLHLALEAPVAILGLLSPLSLLRANHSPRMDLVLRPSPHVQSNPCRHPSLYQTCNAVHSPILHHVPTRQVLETLLSLSERRVPKLPRPKFRAPTGVEPRAPWQVVEVAPQALSLLGASLLVAQRVLLHPASERRKITTRSPAMLLRRSPRV